MKEARYTHYTANGRNYIYHVSIITGKWYIFEDGRRFVAFANSEDEAKEICKKDAE